MSGSPLSFYRKMHTEYSGQLDRLKKIQRIFVVLRLASFIMMIFLPLAFINANSTVAALLFVSFLTLFLFLVKKFTGLERRSRYLSGLLEINLHEIEAQRGNLDWFDDGREFIDPDHHFSFDLDLFGRDSLFRTINRCCTVPGKQKLAGMLLQTAGEQETIRRRQKAVRELAGKADFCQHFLASGRMHDDNISDRMQLVRYINTPSLFTRNRRLVLSSRSLPFLTLGSLALSAAGLMPWFIFALLVLVQLGVTWALLGKINEVHEMVGRSLKTLKKYGELLHIIQSTNFDAPLLKTLQRHLKSEGLSPSAHIKRLAGIVEAFDNRLNVIAGILLNGLLLWDVNCVLLLERWKRRQRKRLPVWLDSMAFMDAYVSLAVFTFNNPEFVFPRIVSSGAVLNAKGMGHPLIPRKERVCNDLKIGEGGRFMIITGANMAGKSTFLRTAGVALVLAMAGAPVCAGEFEFRIMEVYTSMRTSDSLSRNESYFYAELKRLKHLVERLAEGRQVFILLDEILKGTNTADKQKGSVILLEQMMALGATGIIATHDISLASVEKDYPGRIENRCFEVEIDGEKIFFDYLLREGVTRKMNALLLMKQMGLLMDPRA